MLAKGSNLPYLPGRAKPCDVWDLGNCLYAHGTGIVLTIDGVTHKTITDAAKRLKVSEKTVRTWINNGVLPQPPEAAFGTRTVQVFSEAYLRAAIKSVEKIRNSKRRK